MMSFFFFTRNGFFSLEMLLYVPSFWPRYTQNPWLISIFVRWPVALFPALLLTDSFIKRSFCHSCPLCILWFQLKDAMLEKSNLVWFNVFDGRYQHWMLPLNHKLFQQRFRFRLGYIYIYNQVLTSFYIFIPCWFKLCSIDIYNFFL